MKSDVYGFGLLLLELLIGLPLFIANRLGQGTILVDWVSNVTFDEISLIRVVDPRLPCNYPFQGVLQYILLVQKCLDQSMNRPTMGEVLDTLVHINGIKMDTNVRRLRWVRKL